MGEVQNRKDIGNEKGDNLLRQRIRRCLNPGVYMLGDINDVTHSLQELREKSDGREQYDAGVHHDEYIQTDLDHSPVYTDTGYRIFREEWISRVRSAKNVEELISITALARSLVTGGNKAGNYAPQAYGGPRYVKPYNKNEDVSHNSEYDDVRRAYGKKLKDLGFKELPVKMGGMNAIDFLHPNTYEEYTHIRSWIETRGIIFKKQVKVSVEERRKRIRSRTVLLEELCHYGEPYLTPVVPIEKQKN